MRRLQSRAQFRARQGHAGERAGGVEPAGVRLSHCRRPCRVGLARGGRRERRHLPVLRALADHHHLRRVPRLGALAPLTCGSEHPTTLNQQNAPHQPFWIRQTTGKKSAQTRDLESLAGRSEEHKLEPALVEIEDALVPALIVEKLENGSFTVLVPSVPTPMAGSIYIL